MQSRNTYNQINTSIWTIDQYAIKQMGPEKETYLRIVFERSITFKGVNFDGTLVNGK